MKVIFLDFDGVLNSAQSYTYRRLERRRTLFGWLMEFLSDICWKITAASRKRGWFKKIIHHINWYYLEDYTLFCPVACANVQDLLDKIPDLRIVISSVWRYQGLKKCKHILKRNWIDSSKVIDVTPQSGSIRGDDIQMWLDKHSEVEDFVIIDDDDDMGHLLQHLVQTDGWNGFMFRDREKVLEKFKIVDKEIDLI